MKLLLSLLLCSFLCVAFSKINLRPNLKIFGDTNPLFLNETYWAGFQPLDTRGSLFFWLFNSRGNANTDPLVVWLTGGPGCASEIALFVENGPFKVNSDNRTLKINPYSWNNIANVLYVDQPLGTGFSTGDKVDTSEEEIAADFFTFLQEFLTEFPQFKGRDFYITGESYAGHYIPAISANILTQKTLDLNFKGVAIGNGLVSVLYQYPQYAVFAHENNLVDDDLFDSLTKGFKLCDNLLKLKQYDLALVQCQTQVERITGNPPKFNVYDIRQPCTYPPLCYDLSFVDDFLEQDAVESAIGVSGRPWSECNDTVHLGLTKDLVFDYSQDLTTLVESNLSVLVYNGDQDFICNWRGSEALVNNLEWSGQSDFAAMNYTAFESYGEYKHLDNLTFFKVTGAGHMVPMDQPVSALAMLTRFINGWGN